jgi:alpha-glucosidase
MKATILFLLAFLGILPLAAQSTEQLSSPDGKYVFSFNPHDGRLAYSLLYKGKTVVSDGDLGINIDNHLIEKAMGIPQDTARIWSSSMRLIKVDRSTADTTWQPLYGEQDFIRDHYNAMTLHFEKGNADQGSGTAYDKRQRYAMDIIVRLYDEGLAFRYHFPESGNGLFVHVTQELTTFPFLTGTTAWHEAWAQGPFHHVALQSSATVGGRRVWQDVSERPLLLSLSDGLYAAVGEAALSNYVRGKLRLVKDGVLGVAMYDDADVIPPYSTPWRFVMAAERPVELINNKQLLLSLNAPSRYEGDGRKLNDYIRPGRAFRCGKLEKQWIMKSIDFAHDFGIEYVELDAGWYGPEMKVASSALRVSPQRGFTLREVCDYARSKGVGIWLYVNQRALYNQLDSILSLYQRVGVKGIKFGFVQVGNQMWTTWLHEAVKKCAEHKLMVDIHDEYRPTGWSRTYPNLMTQEGIGGNEEMPDARHNTTLPFTRFLAGPADYTLCYFNGRVKNTKAHQLAMSVVYYSPIQFLFWYDMPDAYKGEQELNFWKDCPMVWDESKALDGLPGEYIVQARRSGSSWFVGVLNGMEPRTITVNTADFLPKKGKYAMSLYQDDPKLSTRTKVSTTLRTIKTGERITLPLLKSGGAAIEFKKIK